MGCLVLSHSLHLSFKDHSNDVQTCVNIHFMFINSPDCFSCLFSWYGLLIMVGGVGGDFSQTRHRSTSLTAITSAVMLCYDRQSENAN